jgi:hypothetical protein
MLGKLLNAITNDANTSFVALSIVVSGATVVAVYAFTRRMFNEKTALGASLLAMTSPSVWFHGEVALSYIFDAFFSTLFGYLCWKTILGDKRSLLAASLVLAVAGGVRQNTLLFLFPLWAYTLIKVPTRYRLYSVAVLVMSVLSWYLPMISLTGGYERYREASQELWAYVIEPVMRSGPKRFLLFSKTVLFFTLYGLGLATASFFIYLRTQGLKSFCKDLLSKKSLFFTLWVLPSILFYILVFVHPANPGYSMIYLPALFILAANALEKITEGGMKTRLPRWIFEASLIGAVFFNGYMFLFSDSLFSYGFLKKQHEYIDASVKAVRNRFAPKDTVILGKGHLFFGPRHFMYYLPEYRVYIMDGSLDIRGRKRQVFWGQNHTTYLSDVVCIPSTVKYFVSIEEPGSASLNKGKLLVEGDKIVLSPQLCCYDISLAPLLYPYMKFVWGENREVEEPFRR